MAAAIQPEWILTTLITAILAMLAYLSKLVIEWINRLRVRSGERKSKLIELHSLLLASQVSFNEQCRLRDDLYDSLMERHAEAAKSSVGFDGFFSKVFTKMDSDEKELHQLIRGITENTLRPLNTKVLQWLQTDLYFKSRIWSKNSDLQTLSGKLRKLEAHLYLWESKYLIWMPDRLDRSLVFLADEKNHGIGFPKGIELAVERVLEKRKMFI